MPVRLRLPARLEAEDKRHPGLIPAVGVGAAIVAAYAGLAALHRGAGGGAPAAPAPFPGLGDLAALSGLGLDSGAPALPPVTLPHVQPGGGGYDPIPPVINVGPKPGATWNPIPNPPPTSSLKTRPPSPTGSAVYVGSTGGSRGLPAPTRQGAPTTSHLATVPGTPTPAGHIGLRVLVGSGPTSGSGVTMAPMPLVNARGGVGTTPYGPPVIAVRALVGSGPTSGSGVTYQPTRYVAHPHPPAGHSRHTRHSSRHSYSAARQLQPTQAPIGVRGK